MSNYDEYMVKQSDYEKLELENESLKKENRILKLEQSLLSLNCSAQTKIIDKLKDELLKDRMEQFDDYVIYLLNKYLDILEGKNNEN